MALKSPTADVQTLDFKRDIKIIRNKTMIGFDVMCANHQQKLSTRFLAESLTLEPLQELSGMAEVRSKTRAEIRVPVLRPTRQQTDMYLYHSARQKLEKLQRLR